MGEKERGERTRHQRGEPPPRSLSSRRREIAEVFEAERTRFGEAPGEAYETDAGGGEAGDPLAGGDTEATREDTAFVGQEAPGGPQPLPDQDAADAAGEAYGVRYDEDEALDFEKVGERDLDRRREIEPDEAEKRPGPGPG